MTFDAEKFTQERWEAFKESGVSLNGHTWAFTLAQKAYDQRRADEAVLVSALELARDTLADLPDEIDVTEPFNKIEAAIASTWEK